MSVQTIEPEQAAAAAAEVRLGVIASLSAYLTWGVLPLFLKLIGFAPPFEILAVRILWTVPFAVLAVVMIGGWRQTRDALAKKGVLPALAVSAVFIAINWGIYVWAVAAHRVIESSLAYFLSPLVGVAMGVAFFRERVSRLQVVALTLAGLGVVVQGVALGAAPWAALAICLSWSAYALVRKKAPVPAAGGLLAETVILAPFAALALVWMNAQAPLAATQSLSNAALLALSGPFTAIPLILFAVGARRLRFTTLGLMQYIAPTMQFGIGVAYGEPFTPLRAASFALIWVGLAAFSFDTLRQERARP